MRLLPLVTSVGGAFRRLDSMCGKKEDRYSACKKKAKLRREGDGRVHVAEKGIFGELRGAREAGLAPAGHHAPYGRTGIHVFSVPGRPGMGVHAGRTKGRAFELGGVT